MSKYIVYDVSVLCISKELVIFFFFSIWLLRIFPIYIYIFDVYYFSSHFTLRRTAAATATLHYTLKTQTVENVLPHPFKKEINKGDSNLNLILFS